VKATGSRVPRVVGELESEVIVTVSCGSDHTAAVAVDGAYACVSACARHARTRDLILPPPPQNLLPTSSCDLSPCLPANLIARTYSVLFIRPLARSLARMLACNHTCTLARSLTHSRASRAGTVYTFGRSRGGRLGLPETRVCLHGVETWINRFQPSRVARRADLDPLTHLPTRAADADELGHGTWRQGSRGGSVYDPAGDQGVFAQDESLVRGSRTRRSEGPRSPTSVEACNGATPEEGGRGAEEGLGCKTTERTGRMLTSERARGQRGETARDDAVATSSTDKDKGKHRPGTLRSVVALGHRCIHNHVWVR
jgi:hypothetical protein